MYLKIGSLRPLLPYALLSSLLCSLGCGGSGNSMNALAPLSVTLANPTVVLFQSGTAISQIQIIAPTESVALRVDFLPIGVMGAYSATESNPSGDLHFVASGTAPAGTYMPRITVNSAGREASTVFSLEVKKR